MEMIVQIVEGIFHQEPEGLVAYPDGKDPVPLRLDWVEGRRVNLVAHYTPDVRSAGIPGAGSCLLGTHCPRHSAEPSWLFDFRVEGLVTRNENHWQIDGREVPLSLLEGHRGRLVYVTLDHTVEDVPGGTPETDSVEGLVSQVSELEDLLRELRGIVSRT